MAETNDMTAHGSAPISGPTWMRRVVRTCGGRRALPAFGGISFLESSLLPVPIDLAMIPMGLAAPRRIWLLALAGAFGSVLGARLGYLIGALAFETVGRSIVAFYGAHDAVASFRETYLEHGWVVVLVAGITPLPFKIAAILSGAALMPIHVFLAAAAAIRVIRFLLMAAVIRAFGAAIGNLSPGGHRVIVVGTIFLTILSVALTPFLIR